MKRGDFVPLKDRFKDDTEKRERIRFLTKKIAEERKKREEKEEKINKKAR